MVKLIAAAGEKKRGSQCFSARFWIFLNRIWESSTLSNLWWLQCYLQPGGWGFSAASRGGGGVSSGENLIFYSVLLLYSEWKCLLITQTVHRTSNHHISIGLCYHPNWVFVWWVSKTREGESLNQSDAQPATGTRLDLSYWTFLFGLTAPPNCSPSPAPLSPAWLLTFQGPVFALQSVTSFLFTFSLKLKIKKEKQLKRSQMKLR